MIAHYQPLEELEKYLRNSGILSKPTDSREVGDAITVTISRSGKIVFCSKGEHGLALARISESPRIPVVICAVQKEAIGNSTWEAVLDSLHEAQVSESRHQ